MRRGDFLRVICGLAYWMCFLAQKVEHQQTKLKVVVLIPAEVDFSSLLFFPAVDQLRLSYVGLVALDLFDPYVCC